MDEEKDVENSEEEEVEEEEEEEKEEEQDVEQTKMEEVPQVGIVKTKPIKDLQCGCTVLLFVLRFYHAFQKPVIDLVMKRD